MGVDSRSPTPPISARYQDRGSQFVQPMVFTLPRHGGVATDCQNDRCCESKQRIAGKESGNRECPEGQTLDSQQRVDKYRVHPRIPNGNGGNARPDRMFKRSRLQATDGCNAVCRPRQPSGSRDGGRREPGTRRDESIRSSQEAGGCIDTTGGTPTPLPMRGGKPPT